MAMHGDELLSSSVTGEILNSLLDMFQTLCDEIPPSDSASASKDSASALKKLITSAVKNTLKSHICSCNARHNRGEQYSRLNCMILHGDLELI